MRGPTRRDFLRECLLWGAAAGLPHRLLASQPARGTGGPVPIRGRVHSRGRGLPGVSVTDGRSVVLTTADGSYELPSDGAREFVYISLPAGYRIPVDKSRIARMYRLLDPTGVRRTYDFALEPLETGDAIHGFLALADPQIENLYETGRLEGETVPDLDRVIRDLGDVPLFGVSCGDIVFDTLSLYPQYIAAVARLGIPFLQVAGNHDVDLAAATNEGSRATYRRYFGPSYYSFNRGEIHYVVLDDVFWYGSGYLGYLTADQLVWLEADLASVPRGATVVVFVHIPLDSSLASRSVESSARLGTTVSNRDALYWLLEPFRAHVIAGHTHESEHRRTGGVHEHVTGTVCGAWWSGPICWDGTPNGFAVFTARGSELRWRYHATGYDRSHQMRMYPPGADPAYPQEIVANLWNWEPGWRVVWYEDGESRGEMARRAGFDPLSVELHRGSALPARRTWVEPMKTEHLFYARPALGAREVVVEATDPWGETFFSRLVLPAATAAAPDSSGA